MYEIDLKLEKFMASIYDTSIDELKEQLKKYEKEENYEKCWLIRDMISYKESEGLV